MEEPVIYQLAGLGIGPFNLGLAALAKGIPGLTSIFFDRSPQFQWHKGMMLDNATLQVPFYADLVTLADPCSPFSFMAFLKATGRLFHFAIKEDNFITRREYNQYCTWVAEQLPQLHFHHEIRCINYVHRLQCYEINIFDVNTSTNKTVFAKKLVIGVGTVPAWPAFALPLKSDRLFHSADYLYHRNAIFNHRNVTIVGSGQSAAEIFYDLVDHHNQFSEGIQWFTRSDRFFPMEYSKLSLEMTSPDYIDYFYQLPSHIKPLVLNHQKMLYKGINFDLINAIYDRLYHLSIDHPIVDVGLFTNSELKNVSLQSDNSHSLEFYHHQQQECFRHRSDVVILATSYEPVIPSFLSPISARIRWDEQQRYHVHRNYSIDTNACEIFVQNAEMHTHGFNAPDLGMGAYRNSVILNEILGKEHFKVEQRIAFQTFGIPSSHKQQSTHQTANNFNLTEPSAVSGV